MASDWVSLSEVCEIRRGSSPRPIVNFISETAGMPWVKIADATADESRYITKTNQFIRHEGVSKSVIVEKGDLILSNSGTAGLPKFMGITACIHDGWQVLKKLDGITSEYLYYSLIYIRPFLLHHAYDSVMKNLTLDMVRNARIKLPPIPEQKAIAHILGSLDDKIELNRQMNETLEAMAQTLFKSYFVDFDPVIDNALAAGNAIPDELLERADLRKGVEKKDNSDIQSLFPDAFEFTEEMGWVPKGWKVNSVENLIEINPKITLKKGTVAPHADMKALPESGYSIDGVIKKPYAGGTKFENRDVLFARITPCLENGKTGLVDFLKPNEVGFGSTEFIVLREKDDIKMEFIACLARNSKFRLHAQQSMVGSSGRQRVQNACFSSFYLALPRDGGGVLKLFNEITTVNFEKISILANECQTLAKLRDILLPKLMSGELRIPDAAALVDEVL